MNSFFPRDIHVRSIDQTVKNAEKYLGEICSLLASYTRKTAKLRDKADLLVAQLLDFSSTEDPELQIGLKNLAEDLAMVQDYRQAQVERLETRVVTPLKTYGDIVKTKKADLKKFNTDLNRELKELQKLENIRLRNPADRQSIALMGTRFCSQPQAVIRGTAGFGTSTLASDPTRREIFLDKIYQSQAEVNAQKASNNAQRSVRQLEDTIIDFQRQKLEDIKRIFTDFITVEMLFHAKALEVYTHTYHNLEAVNIQRDLELFNGRVKISDSLMGHFDTPQSSYSSPFMNCYSSPGLASSRSQSFRSTLFSTTGQTHREQHSQYPDKAKKSRSTLQRQRGIEEEDELEGEEDDKDEEEKSEEEKDETYESPLEEGQCTRQSYAAQYAEMRIWQK